MGRAIRELLGAGGEARWDEQSPFHWRPDANYYRWHEYSYTFDKDFPLESLWKIFLAIMPYALPHYGNNRGVFHALLGSYYLDDRGRKMGGFGARVSPLHQGQWRAVATSMESKYLQGSIRFDLDEWIKRYKTYDRLHGVSLFVQAPDDWAGWEAEETRCAQTYRRDVT